MKNCLESNLSEIKEVILADSGKRSYDFSLNDLIKISYLILKECPSSNQIAEPFKRKAKEMKVENNKNVDKEDIGDINFIPGSGIIAKYLNSRILFGSGGFLQKNGVEIDSVIKNKALKFEKSGLKVFFLGIENYLKCFFVIEGAAQEAVLTA